MLTVILVCSAGLLDDVQGCPICDSSTGQQVREGIFNEDFGSTLLKVLLPFPVVALLLAGINKILPKWLNEVPTSREGKSPTELADAQNKPPQ